MIDEYILLFMIAEQAHTHTHTASCHFSSFRCYFWKFGPFSFFGLDGLLSFVINFNTELNNQQHAQL